MNLEIGKTYWVCNPDLETSQFKLAAIKDGYAYKQSKITGKLMAGAKKSVDWLFNNSEDAFNHMEKHLKKYPLIPVL